MNVENQDYHNNELQLRHMHDQCHHYMHHHVLLTGTDGSSFDGIIVNVDANHVTILVGEDIMMREDQEELVNRQYYDDDGYDGYGRPPRRRYRRYRPRTFPIGSLAALALLPYFFPGYGPYYPPYPPYPYPYY